MKEGGMKMGHFLQPLYKDREIQKYWKKDKQRLRGKCFLLTYKVFENQLWLKKPKPIYFKKWKTKLNSSFENRLMFILKEKKCI